MAETSEDYHDFLAAAHECIGAHGLWDQDKVDAAGEEECTEGNNWYLPENKYQATIDLAKEWIRYDRIMALKNGPSEEVLKVAVDFWYPTEAEPEFAYLMRMVESCQDPNFKKPEFHDKWGCYTKMVWVRRQMRVLNQYMLYVTGYENPLHDGFVPDLQQDMRLKKFGGCKLLKAEDNTDNEDDDEEDDNEDWEKLVEKEISDQEALEFYKEWVRNDEEQRAERNAELGCAKKRDRDEDKEEEEEVKKARN